MGRLPKPTGRVVSVHLAGEAYGVGRQGKKRRLQTETLIHAAELGGPDGDIPVRVICNRVKLASVLPDAALYDIDPVSCPECARRLHNWGIGKGV